jgi:hypothetical protein
MHQCARLATIAGIAAAQLDSRAGFCRSNDFPHPAAESTDCLCSSLIDQERNR